MNKKPFIKSSDPSTIEKLKSLGFNLVDESNGFATFINNTSKVNFDDLGVDKTKISYSNMLTNVQP